MTGATLEAALLEGPEGVNLTSDQAVLDAAQWELDRYEIPTGVPMVAICATCGKPFRAKLVTQGMCSGQCRIERKQKRDAERWRQKKMAKFRQARDTRTYAQRMRDRIF